MKKFLIILPVVAFFFISSHSANSMCVYNDTSLKDLGVEFTCGFFCHNGWILQPCPPGEAPIPGCYACRYDKGGVVAAVTPPPISTGLCSTKVANHGWVTIRGTDKLQCTPHQ